MEKKKKTTKNQKRCTGNNELKQKRHENRKNFIIGKLHSNISNIVIHIQNLKENDLTCQRNDTLFSSIYDIFTNVLNRLILKESIKINFKD